MSTTRVIDAEKALAEQQAVKLRVMGKALVYGQLCSYARSRHYKLGWADHKFEALFGERPDDLYDQETIDWVEATQRIWSMERK